MHPKTKKATNLGIGKYACVCASFNLATLALVPMPLLLTRATLPLFLLLGFRERSSAFDLHAAIHDRIKMVHRQTAAVDQARRQQQQSLQWRATQALAPSTPAPAPASAPGAAENNPNEEDWDDFQAAAPAASLGAGGGGDEGGNGRQQQGGVDWDEW